MEQWSYYNFAARSIHTKKLCSRLYSIEIEIYLKNKKRFLSHPLENLWVTYTCCSIYSSFESPWSTSYSSLGLLNIFHYLSWLRRYKRKSVKVGVFQRRWVTLSANFTRKAYRPQTTVGVRKLQWLPFRVLSKYPQCIVWFCHKARVWQTDRRRDRRRTNRRTELRLPRPC